MANPLTQLAVGMVNSITRFQSGRNRVELAYFDHTNPADIEKHGFHYLADAFKSSSHGLQSLPAEHIEAFARHLISTATGTAYYAANAEADALYTVGHAYWYRGPLIDLSPQAVAYIAENQNNAMRLCIRTFANGALELPPATVSSMRERVKAGTKESVLFRELRTDPAIRAYQQSQWESAAPTTGDVMLGLNSIALNTRQERWTLEDNRYIVDIINPATREFHILDGSTLWMRIVDTTTNQLIFGVIGTGKHRYSLIDAFNNFGASGIWQYTALVQQYLYDDVPSTYEGTVAHLKRALEKSDPVAQSLYKTLSMSDNDLVGPFMRGLRRSRVYENGDSYR